jgi:ferritin
MLSEKMQAALNRQINEEFDSAFVYLQMSAESERLGLPGFANWFHIQYSEELMHAGRFFNFVIERNGDVVLEAIAKPEIGPETALSLFEKALDHERHITRCIFGLKDLARSESDHATDVFLEWFINEQVEEESNAQRVIDQLRLVDGSRNGLFMIDRELATRTLQPAAP